MTPLQKRALDFIRLYVETEGVPPTYDEIRRGLHHKSKSGVQRILKALAEQGHIRRTDGRFRNIELCEGSYEALKNKLKRIEAMCEDDELAPHWFRERILSIIRGHRPAS